MIFHVTFKTPDAIEVAADCAGLEQDKFDIEMLAQKYIQYGESVTLEFNTDEQTCEVLRVR